MKDPNERYTICVDFDGVLNSYSSPWDSGEIPDPPVPGAIEWLVSMLDKFQVVILSTRGGRTRGPALIASWLTRYGFPLERLIELSITDRKPAALIYIDDRAYRFTGANFPTASEIHQLRPWNKMLS